MPTIPGLLFVYFLSFQAFLDRKIEDFSGIQTEVGQATDYHHNQVLKCRPYFRCNNKMADCYFILTIKTATLPFYCHFSNCL